MIVSIDNAINVVDGVCQIICNTATCIQFSIPFPEKGLPAVLVTKKSKGGKQKKIPASLIK